MGVGYRMVHVTEQVKIIDGVPVLAPPKGRRERSVPLPDVVAIELAEHMRRSNLTEGQLFAWKDGGLIHRTTTTIRCGSRHWRKPESRLPGRMGCTPSVTITPRRSSMVECRSGPWPNTWGIPTLGSHSGCTPT